MATYVLLRLDAARDRPPWRLALRLDRSFVEQCLGWMDAAGRLAAEQPAARQTEFSLGGSWHRRARVLALGETIDTDRYVVEPDGPPVAKVVVDHFPEFVEDVTDRDRHGVGVVATGDSIGLIYRNVEAEEIALTLDRLDRALLERVRGGEALEPVRLRVSPRPVRANVWFTTPWGEHEAYAPRGFGIGECVTARAGSKGEWCLLEVTATPYRLTERYEVKFLRTLTPDEARDGLTGYALEQVDRAASDAWQREGDEPAV